MFRHLRWRGWLGAAGRFCAHRHTRYAAAWLLALGIGTAVLLTTWDRWEDPKRNDHWGCHTSIDFGSSYVMGRMLVAGHGWFLYDRNHLRNVLHDCYPREDEDPGKRHKPGDAEDMLNWFMGSESGEAARTYASCLSPLGAPDGPSAVVLLAAGRQEAWTDDKLAEAAAHRVTGPLYPPINALFAAPWGLFRPLTAYTLHQVYDLLLTLLAAVGICVLSQGRIWVPMAAAVLLVYPGFFGNLFLAQTSGLALTILIWGWVLVARGRPGWGGAVWGMLAFKPVWAVPYFLVLVLTRRWRACWTMLASGALLAGLTLPFVGVHSWFDWLQIGRDASALYNVDRNWVHLSRDLLGIPRRFLLDFDEPQQQRDRLAAALIGWGLLLSVAAATAAVATWRRGQAHAVTGPRAAFLLLAGWLCCFHFMYYDVLISYLPVMLLFVAPRRLFRPRWWQRQPLEWERPAVWPDPEGAAPRPGVLALFRWAEGRPLAVLRLRSGAYGWLRNPFPVLVLVALLAIENPLQDLGLNGLYDPLDTYTVAVLWAWCGWMWLRRTYVPEESPAGQFPERRPAGRAEVSANGAAATPAVAR